MLNPLSESQFERVQPLFQGTNLSLVINAVIAGNSPGKLWGDDPAAPRSALMWDSAHCLYLVGSADNDAFNHALTDLIAEQIAPEALDRHLGVFKLYTSAEAWDRQIEVIFARIPLQKRERVHYVLAAPKIPDWRTRIPANFRVIALDASLFAQANLKNLDLVVEEIESGWKSLQAFQQNGFGFCAASNDTIVGWCTAEYMSGDQCGIGIETIEAYGRRGIATLCASAFVDACATRGIIPHWDSWKANLPSVAVAEKVGFQKVQTYSVFFGSWSDKS